MRRAGGDFDAGRRPAASGWGITPENTRHIGAADAQLSAADLPRLELKWAFAFPNAQRARSQPAVAYGAVYVGSQDGTVYALDEETGCVRWTFRASAEVRTAVIVESPAAARRHARSRRGSISATCSRACTRSMPSPASCAGRTRPTTTPTRPSPARPRCTTARCTCRYPRSKSLRPPTLRTNAARSAARWWRSMQPAATCAGRPIRSRTRRAKPAARASAPASWRRPARRSGTRRPSTHSAACSTSAPARTIRRRRTTPAMP